MLGGVAAGVADCLGVDVTLVRVAAVVFALMGGLAVPLYVAMWLLVPEEGTDRSILSNFIRGPVGPHPATAQAVNAQGGAMSRCSPFSAPSDEHDWSQAGPYRAWYGNWRRGGWSDSGQEMRVGDTERTQVSDQLSKHYSAGRLDDEEFNERMGRAVGAKTRADLSGLLADLPPLVPAPGSVPQHRHRFGFGSFLMLCLTVLLVGSIASALWWTPGPHIGWIAIAVLAFLVLRWERHRHWHRVHQD
jgi:phage shock protein PspC (stress-responsive transcriptional regulator)